MIIKKLQAIQAELDVPKGQYNLFGKYYYRNAEDILAAAKPICIKHGCLLTVTDEMVLVGDRHYVKATAELLLAGPDDVNHIKTTAYAREELTKKGMDAAQITGAASSYARKYALNGLFCIDDVKDADHNGNHEKATSQEAKEVFVDPSPDIDFHGEEPADGDCVSCGATMTDGQKKVSEKKFGKLLCPSCQKEVA